ADPDLRMAVHARLGRGNAGEGRVLHGGVAVAAVDLEAADVVAVAERHRLLDGDEGVGVVRRADGLGDDPAQADQEEQRSEDGDARDDVEAAVKDLGHCRRAWSPVVCPAAKIATFQATRVPSAPDGRHRPATPFPTLSLLLFPREDLPGPGDVARRRTARGLPRVI